MIRAFLAVAFLFGLSLATAGVSSGACQFPTVNLGSFAAGPIGLDHFATIQSGIVKIGSAQRVTVKVTGCAPSERYRIQLTTPTGIAVANRDSRIAITPLLTAVNGVPLIAPVDLTRNDGPILLGNPTLELIFSINPPNAALTIGTYAGDYAMQFIDQ